MALPLSQLPGEIIREIRSRKWLAFMLFAGVSFLVLAAGFLWPYKYQSEVVIYVDNSNIIGPLMEGSAVTTEISERTSAAKEMLWTRAIMQKVAEDTSIYGQSASSLPPDALEQRIAVLRENLSVRPRGDNFFSIGYNAGSPLIAFKVAQRLGQLFIEESNNRKKAESRSAYDFIDKQVKSYERQLAEVEGKLKKFLSENVDGTEQEANARMADLRGKLELAQLEKAEQAPRAKSLNSQLDGISQTLKQGGTSASAYQERISSMEAQLDKLRLQYHDSYPDIVILREQLAELRKQRDRAIANNDPDAKATDGENIVNPLYQEIKGSLAKARADMETTETRIESLKQLIAGQKDRMERIQANKAEYSDLTRDMEVNKEIYNDLLKRREKARVSMHLDVEGQGLNYRINETAQYPLEPTGAKFPMFAFAGLLLGMLAPFGAAVGMLQIDPRIRARQQLEEGLGLPVLVTIPRVRTPFEKRRERRFTMLVALFAVLVIVIYIAVAVANVLGVF